MWEAVANVVTDFPPLRNADKFREQLLAPRRRIVGPVMPDDPGDDFVPCLDVLLRGGHPHVCVAYKRIDVAGHEHDWLPVEYEDA